MEESKKNRPLSTSNFRLKIVILGTDSSLRVKTMVVLQPYSVLNVSHSKKK